MYLTPPRGLHPGLTAHVIDHKLYAKLQSMPIIPRNLDIVNLRLGSFNGFCRIGGL